MKNLLRITILLVSSMFLSSCGVNYALIENHNQNSTQVHLSSNNYEVVERIVGSAQVNYVLFIGGSNRKQLYANAYANMMDKANLISNSKALVNIVTEEHIGGFPPFYFDRTISVSAHVIEFTK